MFSRNEINNHNYQTVNPSENPETKEWSISVKIQKPIQQVAIVLNNGKKYNYASRYPVSDGDVAIVGNGMEIEYPSATTGEIGFASATLPKLEIKRSHATELDFVFTPNTTKKHISDCIKYISTDEFTYQYGKSEKYLNTAVIYPITYLSRRLLAAASIISFPQYADNEALEKAKAYISMPQIIDEKMSQVQSIPIQGEFSDISISDIHVDLDKKNQDELNESKFDSLDFGCIQGDNRNGSIDPELNSYVNKYAYISAISIMVRGGFFNLLESFLSVNPPIKDFYDELVSDVEKYGNAQSIALVKEYTP